MKPFRMTVLKICPHIQEVTRFLVILHPISTCCYLTIPETFIEYFSKVGFTAPWLKGLNFLLVKQNLENILVKLGDKERFDKEQIGVKEPFPMTKCQFTS